MKIKIIKNNNKPYFSWEYEEQTKIKHKVLGAYSKVWVSKVGLLNDTAFVDCHAGCGSYIDELNNESFGSSVIVKNAAKELENKRNKETKIVCCEKDKDVYNNLLSVLKYNNYDKFYIYNDDFENVLLDNQFKHIINYNSTLFFVDPSGFNFNINSLKNMMSHKGSEILINFMFDFINRFITNSELESTYNKYFGCDDWKEASKLNGSEREEFLVKLYKIRLKEVTKSKFVFFYRLYYPNKKQTYYYLIHCTNHIDGITCMKDIFSSINNGHMEYKGKNDNDMTIFDLSWYKANDMYDLFFKNNRNKKITFMALWENIADKINYTNKDLNKALFELIDDNKIKVERVSSKRSSFKGDDVIYVL